jgi:hypothetical protein
MIQVPQANAHWLKKVDNVRRLHNDPAKNCRRPNRAQSILFLNGIVRIYNSKDFWQASNQGLFIKMSCGNQNNYYFKTDSRSPRNSIRGVIV